MRLSFASRKPPSAVRQRRRLLRICVILGLTPPVLVKDVRPEIEEVVFSTGGRYLLSRHPFLLSGQSADTNYQFWDVATGRTIPKPPEFGRVAAEQQFQHFRSSVFPGAGGLHIGIGSDRIVIEGAAHELVREFSLPDAFSAEVELSSDGRRVAAASSDKMLRIWDIPSSQEIQRFHCPEAQVNDLAWSPDGRLLAWACHSVLHLWDSRAKESSRILAERDGQVTHVAFSPDSRFLMACDDRGSLELWLVPEGRALWHAEHHPSVTGTRFSPDSLCLLSWDDRGWLRLWSVVEGRELWRAQAPLSITNTHRWEALGLSGFVFGVAFFAAVILAVAWLVAIAWGVAALVSLVSGGRLRALAFSPGGGAVAVLTNTDTFLLEVTTARELWSRVSSWTPRDPRTSDSVGFHTSALGSPEVMLSEGRGGKVHFRRASSGRQTRWLTEQFSSPGVMTSIVGPDMQVVAFGGSEEDAKTTGRAVLVLGDSATRRRRHVVNRPDRAVSSLAFSRDGSLLASGSFAKIRLWDTSTGQERAVLTGHDHNVVCLAFSPDGALLASGSEDSTVRLWDVAAGTERAKLEGHTGTVTCLAFSPDGRFVASCGADKTMRLWEAATGKELRRMEGHTKKVNTLALSPDGSFLVSGGDDKTVRAWDTSTGAQLWQLTARRVGIFGYRFERQ